MHHIVISECFSFDELTHLKATISTTNAITSKIEKIIMVKGGGQKVMEFS